jgi:hypothetical protein
MLRPSFAFLFCLLLLSFPGVSQKTEIPTTKISLQNLNDFKPGAGNWQIVGDVYYDLKKGGKGRFQPGSGVAVNVPTTNRQSHLLTNMEHGDIELDLDFMMDKGSNAGVYLQGRYEVQMFDSWGVQNPKASDCGGIYERWDESRAEGQKGYEGHPPALNVSKAPGLWQHFKIVFRAPRFNERGEKVANAVFVQVIHNGVTIHENVEVTGPTRAAAFEDEKPLGPLMIQGDHGPVAIRNISYKAYGTEPVTLSNLTLSAYEGKPRTVADLNALTPVREMDVAVLEHQGSGTKDTFGGKFKGTLNVPQTGDYLFNLFLDWIPNDNNYPERPNGAGELTIGGKRVLFTEGERGNLSTMVHLEAGEHPLTLSYLKIFGYWYAPSNNITLAVEGPGVPYTTLNTPLRALEPIGAISVLADNRPMMLRSFINHQGKKRTHVISVGEPSKVNYTFDLRTGDFLQFWRGNFLETTPMWHGRGETQLGIPLGSVIEFPGTPSLALLANQSTAWPDSNVAYNYLGYDVDQVGRPVFKYTLGTATVRESIESEEGGKKLAHSFTVTPGQETAEIWCKVAEGNQITKLPNGLYAVNDKEYLIELPKRVKPVIRTTARNTTELLLPVKARNDVAAVKYSLVW